MFDYERQGTIRRLLFRYLDSPSLRHLKDPKQIDRLAEDILSAVDRTPSVWTKWDAARGELLKAAAKTWIPMEDLAAFLNSLPGTPLTLTDVTQRLRAFQEEPYAHLYPEERVKEACLALYAVEREAGTELPAIIGRLQEFADEEEQRLDRERQDRWRQQQEAERLALQRRFLSGADCKWTALEGSKAVFMRKNGRTFKLSPTKDKRWELHRIEELADKGDLIGTYLIKVTAGPRLIPSFLAYCLNSPLGRTYSWEVKTDGVSQSNINAKKLAAFRFWLPSLEEQAEVVRRIESAFGWLDRVAADHNAAAKLLPKLDAVILAKAFRGDLVPQNPSDEPAKLLLDRIRADQIGSPKKGRAGSSRLAASKVDAAPQLEASVPEVAINRSQTGKIVIKKRHDPDV